MRIPAFILILFCVRLHAATFNSDGSQSDVASKLSSASDGDTITLPAGAFTWTSGLTINKAVKILGNGGSITKAYSTTSLTIGTGSKVFTVNASSIPGITNGTILRAERTGGNNCGTSGARETMYGDVTSYSGTSLTLNVTNTHGSGTHALWHLVTEDGNYTYITNALGSSSTFWNITEDTGGYVEIGNMTFDRTTSTTGDQFGIGRTSGGYPVLIHDCYFNSPDTAGSWDIIDTDSNKGIFWRCGFEATPFSQARLAIHQHNCDTDSWSKASTMGTDDSTGLNNLYIEDCSFHGWLNATDQDNYARFTARHCLFNHSAIGTHGFDTSTVGQRHFESTFNNFFFIGRADGSTCNNTWWAYVRGGTFIWASNTCTDLSSTDYGNKSEINMTVMALQRTTGLYNACWSANDGSVTNYPLPRQVGCGYVAGTSTNDVYTFTGVDAGDRETAYIFGTTGTAAVGISDFGGGACTSPDTSVTYIVNGRDYTNAVKSGWAEYTYPHPIAASIDGSGGGAGPDLEFSRGNPKARILRLSR